MVLQSEWANVTRQIQGAMNGFTAGGEINTNVNVNQNGATGQQAVMANGKTYQLYFETYNEAGMNRVLRQTEMLYGS